MDFKKFTKALDKMLSKSPELFTEVTYKGTTDNGEPIYDIVVDSYAKRGAKFFKDHTRGIIQSKIVASTGSRKTLRVKYIEGVLVRFDIIVGKTSETHEVKAG